MGQLQLIQSLGQDILEAIEKYNGSMPHATIVGILETIKLQITLDAIEGDEDESCH